MRIVFVIPYFYDAWAYGGQPRSAYEMAKGLVARGHHVTVLTTDSGGDHRLHTNGPGHEVRDVGGIEVHYYRNTSNYLAFHQRLFWPPQFFKDLDGAIRDADVVHIHELRSFLTVGAARAAARQSIPFVLSPHGGLPLLGKKALKRVFDGLWGHRVLKRAGAVLAISPVEEMEARALDVERVYRVPNAVSETDFENLPAEGAFRRTRGLSDQRLVLFLGRLHAVKGADLLMQAFGRLCHELRDTKTHLVVAGPDDGQERELHDAARRLRLEGRVTFTGYLDQKAKLEAMIDSRLVVVPSRSEVFAITAVEALMCARPVLLSSACGLHPMPDEGHGVRLFDPQSIEKFALQMQTAVADDTFYNAAVNGRNFVRSEFSVPAVTDRLEYVYRAVGANG